MTSTTIDTIANGPGDLVDSPYGKHAQQESAGSRQLQARENTEVMAMAMMAKRFPRDVIRASDRIRNAFTRTTLAERAQYQFSRGGTDIFGPSIRAAEAMSQQWGNMSNGWREVSRSVGPDGVGVSEVEAYSVDYETVTRESIAFVVRHWRDTKSGGYKLKDERDIYELCANQAQRRKRACILAQLPGDVTEMAMDQAAATLKAKADNSPEGIRKLLDAFAEFGVSKDQIEQRIQRRIDSIQPAQIVGLKRVYASLRDEMSTVADWFDDTQPAQGARTASIDPETGEVKKQPQAKPTVAVATPRGDGTKPKSYAVLADQVQTAAGREQAALLVDEARDYLPADQQSDLSQLFATKWPER